jgi:hypothetical protein
MAAAALAPAPLPPPAGDAVFSVFAAHVGASLVHRVDVFTLLSVCGACRAGRAACAHGARARAAGVRAAARALAARAAVAWLLRPRAALDEFIRAALYDDDRDGGSCDARCGAAGAKCAEVKLSRVMCPPAMQMAPPPAEHGGAMWGALIEEEGGAPPLLAPATDAALASAAAAAAARAPPVAVALWRCAPPDAAGVPRQALCPRLLSAREAAAALRALYAARFRPIRRRGWYNARPGEAPLWARP